MLDQDVQSRVDAYRGNPQALQQKYSVSKDLLDLMALQKLTKEKESAARELQMAMAAQQGQGAGTIRNQLQQKALGMTKQELEKQQMDLLQQKQQQQQQNLQQLAQSGIAQNPAPNMEGGPGFASGGIIAFAGPTGSEVPKPAFADPYSDINVARYKLRRNEPLTEREETLLRDAERAMIRAFGSNQNVIGSPTQARPIPPPSDLAREAAKKIPISEAEKVIGNIGRASAPGYNGPNPLDERRALSRGTQLPANAPTAYPMPGMTPREVISDTAQRAGILSPPTTAPTSVPEPTPEQTRSSRPAPAVAPVGIATPPAAPTAPQVAQQVIPQTAPQAVAPVASQVAVSAAPQTAPEENEFLTRIKADFDRSEENPGASRQQVIQQFLAQHGLTEEEKADRQQYREALRARHAALTNPEELRREKLIQTLLGMAGASNAGIALARGAASGQNFEAGRNAEALKTLEQLQGMNEGEIAARRKALESGYSLGAREGENVRTTEAGTRQAGLGSLTRLATTDAEIKSREKETAAKINADLTRAGLDNASKERIVAATNQMHKEVENIRGVFNNQAANIHAGATVKSAGIHAGASVESAGIHAAASDRSSASHRDVALLNLIENNSTRLTESLARVEGEIEKGFAPQYKALNNQIVLAGNKITPEIQRQIDKIDADKALAKKTSQNIIQNQIDQLGLSRYGIGIRGGATSGGGVASGGASGGGAGGFTLRGVRPQ